MKATRIERSISTSNSTNLVAETLQNLNGRTAVVCHRFAVGDNGYFEEVNTKVVSLKDRIYLSFTDESEKNSRFYEKAKALSSFQYNGSKVVVNEEGYTTRHDVLKLLEFLNLTAEYLPNYSGNDLISSITYGELGYLLTYASAEKENFPALGKFRVVDPRMKISVISVESTSGKRPEYRLGQYYTGKDFASYLRNLKEGSRPVPLPLYYGFMEYFGDKNVTLLGEVPRKVFLELVSSLKEGSN